MQDLFVCFQCTIFVMKIKSYLFLATFLATFSSEFGPSSHQGVWKNVIAFIILQEEATVFERSWVAVKSCVSRGLCCLCESCNQEQLGANLSENVTPLHLYIKDQNSVFHTILFSYHEHIPHINLLLSNVWH